MTKAKANGNPIEITDNHWFAATMNLRGYKTNGLAGWRYTGTPDPIPLAGLLFAFGSPPDFVTDLLAHLLCGGGGGGLPRLKISPAKDPKHFEKLIKDLTEMRSVRERFDNLRASGKSRKQAKIDLVESEKRKPTWIEDAIALSDEAFIKAITDGALPQSIRKRVIEKATRKDLKIFRVKT